MGGALLLSLTNAAIGACTLTSVGVVHLRDHYVRLGDILSPTCVASLDVPADTVTALPRNAHHFSLSHAALDSLAHRRAPTLVILSSDAHATMAFDIQRDAPVTARCFAAAQPIDAARPVTGDQLAETHCASPQGVPSLEYDIRTRVLRAQESIAAGTYLGPLSVPAHHYPDAGDVLVLVSDIAATHVERPVTATQAAPYGDALFVQDADGRVFKVRLARAYTEIAP